MSQAPASAVPVVVLEPALAVAPADAHPSRLAALVEMTKPGITKLVTITAAVGFAMAVIGRAPLSVELVFAFAFCCIGTALSASGANMLNQCIEHPRDARMRRTMKRAIPSGRITPRLGWLAGIGLCAAGTGLLLATVGSIPALVSLTTILTYLIPYTLLKPVTHVATIIGAIPGALPPLIGWSAATNTAGLAPDTLSSLLSVSSLGGWSLFMLMFVWQIPHFLAIAWMYKDDYKAGGYNMLPLHDPSGRTTAGVILLWSLALLPATLSPAFLMPFFRLSPIYITIALVSGLLFLWAAATFSLSRERSRAKRLFFASIIHLPVLLIAMSLDALIVSL
ncbi:MAG: protoheme IX farnesyltransferase [Phycisphaerales bacterium]|nr:protoheme IX farnesyltransferase [Phycisphaerales bacterium]